MNNRLAAQLLGFTPSQPANNALTTLALSASATWLTYGFVPPFGKTLASVRAYLSAVSGSMVASDLTCSLYSDNGGSPGTLIESHSCAATPTAGMNDWTGFSTALTADTQYWLVFKNANGSPATNFPTFQYTFSNAGADQCLTSTARFGWLKLHTTSSGTSWVAFVNNTAGWRIGYSDGSYDGLLVSNIAFSSDLVYSACESGVVFTAPANVLPNVIGIALPVGTVVGTPTGQPVFNLRNGADAVVSTAPIPSTNFLGTNNGWVPAYLASAKQLTPGATVRVTLAETTNSDTISKGYRLIEYTMDPDANSLTLLPFPGPSGPLKKTYTTDGVNWTDTPGSVFPFALILDVQGEFSAQSGGASRGFVVGG